MILKEFSKKDHSVNGKKQEDSILKWAGPENGENVNHISSTKYRQKHFFFGEIGGVDSDDDLLAVCGLESIGGSPVLSGWEERCTPVFQSYTVTQANHTCLS